MIRVALAEDHDILREGLQSLLKEEKDIKIVAEGANGQELIDLLQLNPVDIILMDINMPVMNGLDATRYITKHFKEIKILVLSMMDHPRYLQQMIEAGASGYVLKSAGKDELVHAIKEVAAGRSYISPEISQKMENNPSASKANAVKLTKRELEILQLLAQGMTNKEIAEKIFLSRRTVETHRKNLIDKTNSKNSFALIRYAMENGILKPAEE